MSLELGGSGGLERPHRVPAVSSHASLCRQSSGSPWAEDKTLRDRAAPGQTVGLVREGEAPRLHLLSEGSCGGAFWPPRG